jgi:hypothetical protein
MSNSQDQEREIRRFLFGELSEAESDEMTLRLLAEETLLDQVEMYEDELIDEYVEGSLSPSDRRRFEEGFLNSKARIEKLELARALRETLPKMKPADEGNARAVTVPRSRPAASFLFGFSAVAASALLALGLCAYLLGELSQLRETIASLSNRLARSGNNQPNPLALVTFALSPMQIVRGQGADVPKIQRTPGKDAVLMQLLVPPDMATGLFTVVVSATGNVQVWSQSQLLADHGVVAVRLAAAAIPPGDYEVALSMVGNPGRNLTYPFRVVL